MHDLLTTNEIRRDLESMGAVHPGLRAVQMVASRVQAVGNTVYWEMRVSPEVVERAVKACVGLRDGPSYEAFSQALHSVRAA